MNNKNQILAKIKEKMDEKPTHMTYGYPVREAAVLLPLIYQEEKWQILFEVRSSNIHTHPGEVCFPGGGMEPGENRIQTALRETCEELLVQETQVEIIGEIDSTFGSNNAPIWACAGILHDYPKTFSKAEVSEVFTVPVQALLEMHPQVGVINQRMEFADDFPFEYVPNHDAYEQMRIKKEVFFYPWENHVIWGATARILHAFLERIQGI